VLGKFSLWRDYFYDGKHARAPLDDQLGLKDGITPGLQRLMSRAGAHGLFIWDHDRALSIE